MLAHPLRLSLLELFAEAPRTTKQAADRLGLPPTRLYHHVAALERVGLVRVRERRQNRGTIEKHYEAVARGFEADPSQLAQGRGKAARQAAARLATESMAALAMGILERAGDQLLASLDATNVADLDPEDARRPLALQATIIATPERVVEMRSELLAVIERWRARTKGNKEIGKEGTMRASLTILLAPEAAAGTTAPGRRTSGSGGRKPGGGT